MGSAHLSAQPEQPANNGCKLINTFYLGRNLLQNKDGGGLIVFVQNINDTLLVNK